MPETFAFRDHATPSGFTDPIRLRVWAGASLINNLKQEI